MSLKSELLSSGSGMASLGHLDDGGNQIVFETRQDVQPILDNNKRLANLGDNYTPSRDLQHVASIPLVVVEQWLMEGINIFDKNDMAKVRQKLNDPDFRDFRTGGGVV